MADIGSFLKKILSAIYGEEVRGFIHDALAAMNTESSSAMEFASTAKDSAQANAAAAKKSAEDADKKAISASESAAAAALSEGSIKTSEENVNKQAADAKEAAAGTKASVFQLDLLQAFRQAAVGFLNLPIIRIGLKMRMKRGMNGRMTDRIRATGKAKSRTRHLVFRSIWYSIRRYVLPLLTSWRQKKSPGSIAAQWIRAICFHDSSLSDTYGHRSRFCHYVLTPPIPFSQIVHCKAKCFPLCQCHHQRVALADSQGAADLFGDDDAAEVVDAPDNACCFHK